MASYPNAILDLTSSDDSLKCPIQTSQESGEDVPASTAHSAHGSLASPTRYSDRSMQSISTATYDRQEQDLKGASSTTSQV